MMSDNTNDIYDPARDELVRDRRGNSITADYLDRAEKEAEAGFDLTQATSIQLGRPPLSSTARGDSPQIRFRVPANVRQQAEDLARHEGKTLSQLARESLEEYLKTHRPAA